MLVVVAAGATTIDSAADADAGVGSLSVTPTVNWYVPAVVGVPRITPADESSHKPVGSDPDRTVHVNGPTPPDSLSGELGYGAPTVAPSRAVVVTASCRPVAGRRKC